MTVKEQAIRTLEELPENASMDDVFERLYLIYKVQRGIEQANAGEKISQEEARRRMSRWLE